MPSLSHASTPLHLLVTKNKLSCCLRMQLRTFLKNYGEQDNVSGGHRACSEAANFWTMSRTSCTNTSSDVRSVDPSVKILRVRHVHSPPLYWWYVLFACTRLLHVDHRWCSCIHACILIFVSTYGLLLYEEMEGLMPHKDSH